MNSLKHQVLKPYSSQLVRKIKVQVDDSAWLLIKSRIFAHTSNQVWARIGDYVWNDLRDSYKHWN